MKILLAMEPGGFREALQQKLQELLGEAVLVATTSHEDALVAFLTEEPTHVLVGEYDHEHDRYDSKFAKGYKTWKDLSVSKLPEQKLARCGFVDHTKYPDFIRLPFLIEDLLEFFKKME
jgi:hypothetical protein